MGTNLHTQEEMANRVAAMANQAKKPIKTFASELQKSGRLREIQHSMMLSKTIDFLLEHAKVTDTSEHLESDSEEEATQADSGEPDKESGSDSPDSDAKEESEKNDE